MNIVTAVQTRHTLPNHAGPGRIDAISPGPGYSAVYVIIRTDVPGGHAADGFVFPIGRGNQSPDSMSRAAQK